jgi:DNA-directed RNA polymerase subunit beta
VGELLTNQLKTAFTRMERIAKERMSLKETDTIKPQDLISIKPIVAAIKEFFGSSQLSQFMDQVNPLSELTHKRRLNALGPGGLSRDRAGFEVRDVHYTHYGRMCPIETPEGPNIGLIVSLANYTRVNDYGFLETRTARCRRQGDARRSSTSRRWTRRSTSSPRRTRQIDKDGKFLRTPQVSSARAVTTRPSRRQIQYMDVSPKQIISVSASLIPFLEHDDANRALMGSNMQRQAVPLVFPEPRGSEPAWKARPPTTRVCWSRRARPGRSCTSPPGSRGSSRRGEGGEDQDVYELIKYQRTNQDTCFTRSRS